jgi:hypothetical protein
MKKPTQDALRGIGVNELVALASTQYGVTLSKDRLTAIRQDWQKAWEEARAEARAAEARAAEA